MLYEREFFAYSAPRIAKALNTAERTRLIEELQRKNPVLHGQYMAAKSEAQNTLEYVRTCGCYPLTGTGRTNTYAVFAELARAILAPGGRIGLLVPSGIATDSSTKDFFADVSEKKSLAALYDFENRKHLFPDVDPRFRFCVLLLRGLDAPSLATDFFFFAHEVAELQDTKRHIKLSAKDIALLNPNTRTCPIFRSGRDGDINKAIYKRVPILIDHSREHGGNPWGLRFKQGLFNQSSDSSLFRTAETLKAQGFTLKGNCWLKGKATYLPLYEAKMVQVYDHRAASVSIVRANWLRQGQPEETSLVSHQNPECLSLSRYWVLEEDVLVAAGGKQRWGFVAFKDITSATNTRTMIAAAVPWSAIPHPLPFVLTDQPVRLELCLLANLNSFAYDYLARQKVMGNHLTFFIVEQLPTFPPDRYAERCPWDKKQTLEKWISDRVLKLTCTANDMKPLAEAAGFEPPVHKWNPSERADLMAELDAAFFHLYGIARDDVEYILGTFQGLRQADPESLIPVQTAAAQRILETYDRLAGGAG